MFGRIKQFVRAVSASISPADRSFAAYWLNTDEGRLFWGMNMPDQRHALNVAYTCLKLAEHEPGVDVQFLVKCALLHDVGKKRGDVSTADKVIAVLANRLLPKWSRRWSRKGRGGRIANLRHALYIYYNHGPRGAALLAAIGDMRIAQLIAVHHVPPSATDRLELRLLKAADDLN